MPTNVWVWKKEGRKKPSCIDERFCNDGEFKALVMKWISDGSKFQWEELPSCAEGWSTFKITFLVEEVKNGS
jgi:hypothetical protein